MHDGLSSPSTASSTLGSPFPRLKSVDVFRGATIAAMILVNAQFSREESYRQLVHSIWNGWTFADTIFPCFLFIVGVSLALSTASRTARGEHRADLLSHAIRRSVLIFALGVAVETLRFPAHDFLFFGFQDHLQFTGALQKISICYLVAFAIYLWGGSIGAVVGILGLNLLYLGLLYFYPVPGCGAGSLAATCNFPDYLDSIALNGLRQNGPGFNPDGLGTILPATTSVLFGVLAGQMLIGERRSRQQILQLLAGGILLIVVGEFLSAWVPINKQLWTTSFAVVMAGFAATSLGCTIGLVDGYPSLRLFKPLDLLGMNSIAAYVISRFVANVPRVHVMGKSLYSDVFVRLMSPANASLLFAVLVLVAVYVAVWLMHRMGWNLKL